MVMVAVFTVMRLAAQPATPAVPAPAASNAAPSAMAVTNDVPRIRMLESVHDFGKVQAGQVVQHDFVVTNMGTRTLEILNVQPSCGCTTAGTYDRKIAPGQTGKIPVQFNSGNLNGPVSKAVTISCNDRSTPSVIVQMRALVWKPVLLEPTFAVFSLFGPPTTNDVKIFKITNNMPEPLFIQSVEVSGRLFSAQLSTNTPGRDYLVTVRPAAPLPSGTSQATVLIKPVSTNTLPLTATVVASVQEPILVLPSQLMLPASPLRQSVTLSALIRNIHPNPIVLSNATVNVPNIDVQVAENHPGHTFTVTLTFPPNFEIRPDQDVHVSVNSSYPDRPVIKVPIRQQRNDAVPPTVNK